MHTARVVAAAALLACACSSKTDHAKEAEAKLAAERHAAERHAITALASSLDPAPSTARPPLVPPGKQPIEGPAADLYEKAGKLARPLLAERKVTPDAVFGYLHRWPAAPQPLRDLARHPKAKKVAALVAAGARHAAGAHPTDKPQSPETWRPVAAVVAAHALEQAAGGDVAGAAWNLLALARLGQDLARASGQPAATAGADLVRAALDAFRATVELGTEKTLPPDALEPLLSACQSLRQTTPSYADLLDTARHRRIETLADLYGGDEPPAPHATPLSRRVESRGGLLPYLDLEGRRAAAIAALREAKDQPAHTRLALLTSYAAPKDASPPGAGAKPTAGAGTRPNRATLDPTLAPTPFARWLLARADLAATCLALTLETDRRTRGKLAPSLEALAEGAGDLPQDPIGQRPFDYVPAGSGRLLRSRPVELAGKPAAVEVQVPGQTP